MTESEAPLRYIEKFISTSYIMIVVLKGHAVPYEYELPQNYFEVLRNLDVVQKFKGNYY